MSLDHYLLPDTSSAPTLITDPQVSHHIDIVPACLSIYGSPPDQYGHCRHCKLFFCEGASLTFGLHLDGLQVHIPTLVTLPTFSAVYVYTAFNSLSRSVDELHCIHRKARHFRGGDTLIQMTFAMCQAFPMRDCCDSVLAVAGEWLDVGPRSKGENDSRYHLTTRTWLIVV